MNFVQPSTRNRVVVAERVSKVKVPRSERYFAELIKKIANLCQTPHQQVENALLSRFPTKFLTENLSASGLDYFMRAVVSIPLSVAAVELRQTGITAPTSVYSTTSEKLICGPFAIIVITDGTR